MRIVNLLKMTCVACLLTLWVACSEKTDNPATPSDSLSPTDELADFTVFIYGHTGGDMDDIIENVYKEAKPLLTDKKKLRVLFFYKYGNSKSSSFNSEYANEDEVLRFELTADTDLDKLRTEACFEENSQYQLYSSQNLTEQLNWVAETAPAKNTSCYSGAMVQASMHRMTSTNSAVPLVPCSTTKVLQARG